MPKLKLDNSFCLTATCPSGKRKVDYWDTITSGFVLEVRSTGGKTYYLRYMNPGGRQHQHKIGGFGDLTFDQARKKAKQLRSQVTLGEDPAVQKADRKAVPTYAALAKQHLAHARTHLRTAEDIETIMRLHLLPRWEKLRLDQIHSQDIALWLSEKRVEGLAPATVEKLRVTLNRSFVLAARWKIAGGQHNPVTGVERPRFNNKKERFLTADEARRVIQAAEASPNPLLASIVRLLLLTGARKTELLRARWEDVHLERQAWHIPMSKNGHARHVPLSQAAIDVINSLPKWNDCPWLIPNPDTLEPFTDIKKAWMTARRAAGLPSLRIHDLRHSAASFMINAGTELYAVGKILGHVDYQSTQRYSHLASETLLAAVEAGAAKMRAGRASAGDLAHGL